MPSICSSCVFLCTWFLAAAAHVMSVNTSTIWLVTWKNKKLWPFHVLITFASFLWVIIVVSLDFLNANKGLMHHLISIDLTDDINADWWLTSWVHWLQILMGRGMRWTGRIIFTQWKFRLTVPCWRLLLLNQNFLLG